MLLSFKVTQDDSLWVLDTDKLLWGRVSEPVSQLRPGSPPVEEFGKLKIVSPLVELYRLEGREPKTEGPGCGLTSVAILVRILAETLEIGVNANVPIKEPVCISIPYEVKCQVLGQHIEPVQ